MPHLSAKQQLLLLLTVILFFSFVGGSLLNYKMTRASVHSEILRNDLPLTMDNIYSELTSEMTKPLLVSSSMASDTFLKEWASEGERDPGKITRYLMEIKEKYGFFTTFFVSLESNKYYRHNGIHKMVSANDSHDVWFFDFLSSGKEYDFDVDADEAADNSLTIFINYRVVNDAGDPLGVVGVGLMVDRVAKTIEMYQKKYDRSVFLTDIQGTFQVHPDTTLIENKKLDDFAEFAPLTQDILQTRDASANFEYDRLDQKILLTVRYIKSLQWLLYVEQNETKALVTARHNFIRTVVIGLITSILIITLALLTINRYQEKIELLAAEDELTGAANRRALGAEFSKIVYNYSRKKGQFSLILLDLDNFKMVNDTLGHLAGDKLLVAVVELIKTIIRPTDIFARWGGDEFVILTEGEQENSVMVAKRICQALRNNEFGDNHPGNDDPRNSVRVSSGITRYVVGDSLDTMLLRADSAMYQCKSKGGDCVEVENIAQPTKTDDLA